MDVKAIYQYEVIGMVDATGQVVGMVPLVMSVGILDKTMDMTLGGGSKPAGKHRGHRHRRRR